tara:strand:- start:324 stop:1331 length:1008 start_codon:yes stop_codon:yes gene_type:complete
MSNWTIVSSVYNEYLMLRQMVESLQYYVDLDSYEEIIIVDDYSRLDTKLRPYLEYLATKTKFNVTMHDEYRWMMGYQDEMFNKKIQNKHGFNYKDYPSGKHNLSHSGALWKGVQQAKTKFVLCVDVDIIFLENSFDLLKRLEEQFRKYPKAIIVGQTIAVKSSEIKECYKPYQNIRGDRVHKAGGYTSAMASAIRMDAWSKHNLNPIYLDRRMSGVFNNLMISIFENGFSALSYPIYSEMNLLHVGRGVARKQIKAQDKDGVWYGFLRDFQGMYGSRYAANKLYDYHTGSHMINMYQSQYRKYLHDKFEITEFLDIQSPLQERFIKPVEDGVIFK